MIKSIGENRNMDGILVINKEEGKTSREIVNSVSKILGTKKIGHTGTLDPLATGVLVLCVGKCTKVSELITSYKKQYVAEVELGTLTDTLDVTGSIIREEETTISKGAIESTLAKFKKTYMQEVPIYSAVKIKGKRLYEYAREGKEVTLPKREITIFDIHMVDEISYKNGKTYFSFWCEVSKGTYIRSLIHDIASSLHTIGSMKHLCRVKQGNFDIEESYTLEQIQKGVYDLMPLDKALEKYTKKVVSKDLEEKIRHGQVLPNHFDTDYPLFVSNDNILLALYKPYEEDFIKPWKMFL